MKLEPRSNNRSAPVVRTLCWISGQVVSIY